MAHGTLREFDVTKESIEDFRQRFEFYCLANNIKNGDEAQRNRKKALFITLLGQTTFANLRDLASPREITDISLDEIIDLLKSHYRPQTVGSPPIMVISAAVSTRPTDGTPWMRTRTH